VRREGEERREERERREEGETREEVWQVGPTAM
jgi:hypothetical protein